MLLGSVIFIMFSKKNFKIKT